MTAAPAPTTNPAAKPGPAAPRSKDGAVALPTIRDARGALTFMEGDRHLPFPIRRAYLMYDVAPGQTRGHHAHHACRQALVVVAGRVTLVLDDGRAKRRVVCDRPSQAVLIEPMVWHSLEDFAPGTVCLVLASHVYDEADYIRDRATFDRLAQAPPRT